MRSCEACGKQLPTPCHPRRRFCNDSCRKRSHRVGEVVDLPSKPGVMERATLAQLDKHDAGESFEGAAALVLAARLDLGRDTGSAMAAMTRELRTLVADATAEREERRGDRVDELRAQRERRQQRVSS